MDVTCPACAEAKERPSGRFLMGCRGCIARGVSRTINYRDSQQQGRLTHKYRLQLEQAGVSHEEVKAAAAGDFESKENA